jgi:hypothetical protein
MKTFNNICAQGDILIRRIAELPSGVEKVEPENGKIVVAHSETMHNHIFDSTHTELYSLPDDIMKCLLVVNEPTPLVHERSYDTHEPILFQPGIYEVRRQREYTPEGFRRVED